MFRKSALMLSKMRGNIDKIIALSYDFLLVSFLKYILLNQLSYHINVFNKLSKSIMRGRKSWIFVMIHQE